MSTLTNELNQKIEQTKKFLKNIKGTMEAIVKNYIGRHVPIKFHIGQGTSHTNEKTIDIVIQPEDIEKYSMDEIAREVRFLVGHECQHIKSSVLSEFAQMQNEIVNRWMKIAKDNVWAINVDLARDMAHYIGNSLEDGRIENIMCNDYPGLKKHRKWFRLDEWMSFNCKDVEEEQRSTVSTILSNIHCISTMGIMLQGFEEVYTTESIEYKKTMETLPYIRQAVAAPTCKNCLDAAREICYILEDIILDEICLTENNCDEMKQLMENMEQMKKQMNENNFGNGQSERLNEGPIISILDDEERKGGKSSQDNDDNNYILDLRKEEPKKKESESKKEVDENNSSENDENTDNSQNSEKTSKRDENTQNGSSEDNADGSSEDNADSNAVEGSNLNENSNGGTNNSSDDKNADMSQSDAKNSHSKSSDDSKNKKDSKNDGNMSGQNGQTGQDLDGEMEDGSKNSGSFSSSEEESKEDNEANSGLSGKGSADDKDSEAENDGSSGSSSKESQDDKADGSFGSSGKESNQDDETDGSFSSSGKESNQDDEADGSFGSSGKESNQDDEADGSFSLSGKESNQDDETDESEDNSSMSFSKEGNSKEDDEASNSSDAQKSNARESNETASQLADIEAKLAENTLGKEQKLTPEKLKQLLEAAMQIAKDKTSADAKTLVETSNAIEIAETERKVESGNTSLTCEEVQKIADKFGGRSYEETKVCEGGYYSMIDAPAHIKALGENIHSRIENIINSLSTPDREEVYEGEVDANGLFKLCIGEYDVFREEGEPREADIACFLLKDNSGSMRGKKEIACCEQLAILEEGLRGLVKMKIASFTDWGEVQHFIIKDWDSEDTISYTWSYHQKMSPSGSNHDAYSIMVATEELLKRSENQKLLIVLSDGAPCCDSADVRAAVRSAREQGVFVISIFFGYDDFAESNKQYYQDMYEKYYIGTTPDKIGFHLERLLEIFMETT